MMSGIGRPKGSTEAVATPASAIEAAGVAEPARSPDKRIVAPVSRRGRGAADASEGCGNTGAALDDTEAMLAIFLGTLSGVRAMVPEVVAPAFATVDGGLVDGGLVDGSGKPSGTGTGTGACAATAGAPAGAPSIVG